MNTGETPKKMGIEADTQEQKILVNGEKETVEELMAIVLNDEGTPKNDDTFFSFNNSAKMPVIIRMKNGFYLALKEIKSK